MKEYDIFDKYTFVPALAKAYGFQADGNCYTIKKPLRESGFYAVFEITGGKVKVNVYEEPDDELYFPFHISADTGGFVSKIRAEVDDALSDIVTHCCALSDVKAILLDYVREKYGTVPEAPWKALEEYHTLNTAKRHKWYGLFMLIPYRYLGIEKEGKIHVLNLKLNPQDISSVIDYVHYFPSYHMNKKYWISILLDKTADVDRIKQLLDASYAIVDGKNPKDKKAARR